MVFSHNAGADAPEFAPTITIQTSTTRAAAHPDARITIDNTNSTEQIKDLTIDLPDGMVGSLNAAEQCTVAQATAENCPANSQIGTVINHAKVDNSDVVLRGKVYLTEALPLTAGKIDLDGGSANSSDPASMQIVVPGKIGGVDMGNVVVNSRVQMHYADLNPDWGASTATGSVGSIRGVRTIVNDVPREITDSHNRTVSFQLKKLVVDLKSDQSGPYSKLLTNSSRCRTTQLSLSAASYDATSFSDTDDYTTTQCADVPAADPESMSFDFSDKNASAATTFESEVVLADDQPTLDSMTLQMPPSIAVNAPAVGSPTQQCPVNNLDWGVDGLASNFTRGGCPPEAKVGSVEIETPLLPDPVIGELWLVEASPVPNMGIYIDPNVDLGNPKGVTLGIGGTSSTPNLVQGTCSGVCRNAITMTFTGLPDMPIKKIKVIGDPTPRPATPVPLSGNILNNASASDLNCQPLRDASLRLTSWVGWDDDLGQSDRKLGVVASDSMTGCDAPRAVTMGAVAPFGGAATTNPPDLSYTNAQNAAIRCGVDTQLFSSMTPCNPAGGIGGGATFTPAAPLEAGVHHFFGRVSNVSYEWRTFSVPVDAPTDTTAPTVTLNEPGTSTSDTTPSVDFSSDEDAYFQCSLDGGPFLPCDTGTAPNQASSYTVASALIPNNDTHTIDVRAQDAAGNVSTPEQTSFKVEVPLDPTLDIDLSTDVARAHPTMDLTVTSGSHEDITDLALSMPDGFMGALTGVQSLCSIATAEAGNCTAASEIGTVDTEAVIEGSETTVRLAGKVFMTEPIVLGDPAGLYVDVPAVIQEIDDGHVLVPIRLKVRGEAQGIDSIASDLPTALNPADWGNTWDQPSGFDLRSITLKLRNNPSASQPILTNPSSCNAGSFAATFTGADATVVNKSVAFAATNCAALPFTPSLSITQKDSYTGSSTPTNSSPARRVNVDFTASLTSDPNGAGIKQVNLTLPKTLTIDVGHLPYPCMPDQAAAKACPASSAIGSASATSPLLAETLYGTVYVLKSTTSLPRLLVAMRGRINADFIGENSFVNINQIVTDFNSLPDVPLSSFSMTVNKFLMTRDEACEVPSSAWNIVGTMGGHNGSAAAVNNPLTFDCAPAVNHTERVRWSGKGSRFTSSVELRATGGKHIKSATLTLPKGVKLNTRALKSSRAMARRIKVTAGRHKVSSKCVKKSGSSKLKINFTKRGCKKSVTSVKVTFKRGSLKTKKKFSKKHPPKFKTSVVTS